MSLAKSIARKFVFPLLVNTGLEKLFSASSHNNLLIVVYHGVVEKPDHSVSVGPIATSQFAQHLAYYKKNFDVVSQSEIFRMYRDGHQPARKTIAITFDDGYENNYTNAFPLLKKYGFASTMYIISQCVEDDSLITWYDYLDFVKKDLNVTGVDTAVIGKQQQKDINGLKNLVKSLSIQQRNLLYAEIAKQVNIEQYKPKFPREYWKLMNKMQLRELAQSGLVEIAAHSHNHPNLGLINIADAKEEVVTCKRLLEETIQKPVKAIAYPDGSYTAEVKKVCLDAGYENLLAVDYRLADDVNDKNILPRYCISSTTTFESNMIAVNRAFNTYGF
ncbi:MAG TPA: polysaccharide deacetylase family protein [Chitinophagales bacterium]|nr:polysaccharide deacetylase family protein [Chitinophagales bacterium]